MRELRERTLFSSSSHQLRTFGAKMSKLRLSEPIELDATDVHSPCEAGGPPPTANTVSDTDVI
jgi:hypothetical protein